MSEHIVIRTGDNNLLICQATDCDCVEIRSSASPTAQPNEPSD